MRTLTDSEWRTIRLGGIGLGIYLVLFGGLRLVKFAQKQHTDYGQLRLTAEGMGREVRMYQDRVLIAQKMMDVSRMDPAKLSRATVVAEASAAIQRAAASGGIQVGPVRESAGQGANKEVASMQLEGVGPVPAILSFLQRFNSLGYPLIIDSVQMTPEKTKPGMIKVSLTVIVIDFDQWKSEGGPHA
jgi:hypothetical protein